MVKGKNSTVAYKSTEMIQLKGNIISRDFLSEAEQKAVMYIASQVRQDSNPEDRYSFEFHKFAGVAGLDRSGKLYREITDMLYGLVAKRVRFRDESAKGDKVASMIVSPTFYDNGAIEYKVDENLLPHFKAFAAGFTMIDVTDYMRIRGKYPLSLYELMLSWAGKGNVEYTVEELRGKLSVPEGTYPRSIDFIKQMRLAVDEINEKSSKIHVVATEKIGSRRKVEAIRFTIKKKRDEAANKEVSEAAALLCSCGVSEQVASDYASQYSLARIRANVELAKSRATNGQAKQLPAIALAAVSEDYAEVEQISLLTAEREAAKAAAQETAAKREAAQRAALEAEAADACEPVKNPELAAMIEKMKRAAARKDEEQTEPSPTAASAERILNLEADNAGMHRGKWQFIADTLNKNMQYDSQLKPWTADSIKKAWQRLRVVK